MKSLLKTGSAVSFPKFTKERAYMVPFTKEKGLPRKYARWQKTVNSMLEGIESSDVIYLTIDQAIVKKGENHRRSGAHIDGVYSNGKWDTGPDWIVKDLTGGGIVLASDRVGCKAYEGEFSNDIGDGGDCSNIDLSGANVSILEPNQVYIGNVTMVHETMPATETQNRSFVRLTLPESWKY